MMRECINSGMDYWTGMFLVFTHFLVGLIDSHALGGFVTIMKW